MRTNLVLATFLGFFLYSSAFAKLRVVTTTEDLASITRSVGGELTEVSAIVKGTQDPHFIEAKPSFLVTLSRADLLICMGLSLEQGWLPLLQRGARQPSLLPGASGFMDASAYIKPIEVAASADRSEGDVHPFGNPHFMGNPENAVSVAEAVSKRLATLDAQHASAYQEGYLKFKTAMSAHILNWKKRLAPYKGIKLIGYHKTFNYFFDFFDFHPVEYLEPKAGIPPTAQHILKLIDLVKNQKVSLIVMEDYFDDKAAVSLSSKTGTKMLALPAYTGGSEKTGTYELWFEYLVAQVEKTLSQK